MESNTTTPTASESMPDVQGYTDTRHIAINRVGIKGISSPVIVQHGAVGQQSTVATFCMAVYLPEDRKGTHMSRFTQLLTEHQQRIYSVGNFVELYSNMCERLDSTAGSIDMRFPYFIEKMAPVTSQPGMLEYAVALKADSDSSGNATTTVCVDVPVTTLCPCSKEISKYGAHSQRSQISIEAVVDSDALPALHWDDLITLAEAQGSAQLYSLLKRADEKFVTEHAYENPKFVEDLIRDVATSLNADQRIASYALEVENFESIHNHSAWAKITA